MFPWIKLPIKSIFKLNRDRAVDLQQERMWFLREDRGRQGNLKVHDYKIRGISIIEQ